MLKGFWKTQKVLKVNFINKIRNFKFELKLAWQRAYRGYDDSDVWGLSDSITQKIIQTLEEFIENNCSYPSHMTEEKWIKELNIMLDHFKYSDEEWCIHNLGYCKIGNTIEEYKLEDETRLKHRKLAYEMFVKYFDHLWI